VSSARSFELLVTSSGKRSRVVWDGLDGPNAAQQYANSHPGVTVIAWQIWPTRGFFPAVDVRRVAP
jgi:hypothetical protein